MDFTSVYRRCQPMVRAHALRMLGNTAAADDVTQDVFVQFLRRRHAGDSERDVAAFLYRMTTNAALNRLRNQRRRHELDAAQSTLAQGNPLPCVDPLALRRVLTRVPEDEARIAAYYYVEGLEQEEIAELLCIHRRAVGRRLERFRERARALLKNTDGDPHGR